MIQALIVLASVVAYLLVGIGFVRLALRYNLYYIIAGRK